MKTVLLRMSMTLLLIALGCGAFVLMARSGWLKPDEEEMRARYALPDSHFIELKGQSIHYVDEGRGPTIILVHGSFASVRQWDAWAEVLRKQYRVIRFDRPFMGLSGPSPDGRSDGETDARILAELTDHLKLDRFALVATSSAGEGVSQFAAQHPTQVSALVLANIAAGPVSFAPGSYPFWFRTVLAVDPLFKGWHPPAFWRGVLEQNFADTRLIKADLVREWTDLNNLAQGSVRVPRPKGVVPFAGTPKDLAAIRAPTLLLWSDQDHELPYAKHGQDALRLLASSDKALIIIPRCGHMMPQECGETSVEKAVHFFKRVLPVHGGGGAIGPQAGDR